MAGAQEHPHAHPRKPHALLSQKTQEEENEVEIKENKGNE